MGAGVSPAPRLGPSPAGRRRHDRREDRVQERVAFDLARALLLGLRRPRLFFLSALAAAQDHGHPGVLLPGAGDLASGHGSLAAGAGFADVLTGEGLDVIVGGPVATGVVGVGDRVALNAAAVFGFAGTGLYGLWAVATPHAALSARVVAIRAGGFHLAPWGMATIGALPGAGLDLVVAGGVAAQVEAGRFALDASVPVVSRLYQRDGWSDPRAWRATEVGLSYQIDDEMRFRFGFASVVPVITIRRVVGNGYVDVSWLWLIDGYFVIQGGVAF